MPSARFEADFASFYEAVSRADLTLKGFDSTTHQVESSLNSMVDTFTGRRVISEAALITEAITRIGSPSRLTASELQRAGAAAAEAAEKMRRLGEEVPPKFDRLAAAAARARGETANLGASMRQFDGVLSSVGVNIGAQSRALEDLANASGKSASQIGVLGVAGLATGAGIAGWQTGRAISEFFGLDKSIGDATARLLGFGDVAGQEAAAGNDVLARATKNAGYEVTNMAEAMKINELAALRTIAANTKQAEASRQLAADDAKATALMEANRRKMIAAEHDLAVAIQGRQAADRAAYAEMAAESANNLAAAHRDVADAQRQEAEGAAELGRALQEADIASQQAQAKIRDDARLATVAIRAEQDAAAALARTLGNSIEYDLSSPGGLEQFKRLNPGATFQGAAARPEYFQTHTLADAVRDGLISYGRYANSNPLGPYSTGGNSPGPVGRLLVADLGPEAIRADGRGTSGGIQVYAPVHVSGVFDPSAKEALSSAVRSGLSRSIIAGRH